VTVCFWQRVVVNDKVVSQLCDEAGNLSKEEFEQAMRKQAIIIPSTRTIHKNYLIVILWSSNYQRKNLSILGLKTFS
jgi:hypothetical protein